jgi:hypothetical protein
MTVQKVRSEPKHGLGIPSGQTPAFRSHPRVRAKDDVRMILFPRRGVPHPLSSASAVSHDLDGLPLSRLSNVFQLVTLMGFGFRWDGVREGTPSGGPKAARWSGSSRLPLP